MFNLFESDSGGADIKVTFNVLVRYNSGSVGEASGDEFIVDIYPNPVSRFLYVRGGVNPMDASIRVKSSSGAVVYNDKVSISGFSPCAIDMKNTAPGQYSVTVEAGGNSVTKTVVKR